MKKSSKKGEEGKSGKRKKSGVFGEFLKNIIRVRCKTFYFTALLELAFLFLTIILWITFIAFTNGLLLQINSVMPVYMEAATIISSSVESGDLSMFPDSLVTRMEASTQLIKGALIKLGMIFLVFLLVMLALFSYFHGKIWSMIKGEHFTRKEFLSFFSSSALYFLVIVLIFFAFIFIFKINVSPYLVFFELIVFLYLSPIFFSVLKNTKNFFANFYISMKTGFLRIHLFILTYIILFFILLAALLLIRMVVLTGLPILILIFGILVLVWFLSFARIYFFNNVLTIRKTLEEDGKKE